MKEPVIGIRKYVFIMDKSVKIQQKVVCYLLKKKQHHLEIKKPRIVRRGT